MTAAVKLPAISDRVVRGPGWPACCDELNPTGAAGTVTRVLPWPLSDCEGEVTVRWDDSAPGAALCCYYITATSAEVVLAPAPSAAAPPPSQAASLNALIAIAAELGDDELAVLLRIAERLRLGRAQYGELDIATDERDWLEEAHAEIFDKSVYLAIEVEKIKRRRDQP